MNALDESMDEKLERLERENEQLRQERTKILFDSVSMLQSVQLENKQLHNRILEMQSLLLTAINELATSHADKQELMDALGPLVTGAWVPLQTLQFAKATYDKHYESMT